MTLIEEMIQKGVNINNYQEVYNYFHNRNGESIDIDAILNQLKPEMNVMIVQAITQSLVDRVRHSELNQALSDKVTIAQLEQELNLKTGYTELNEGLSTKLDKSEYQQHFRGVFIAVDDLNLILNPIQGDYAHVDAGVGFATTLYSYDANDKLWRPQQSNGVSLNNTDELVEGNANLYFTEARVLNVINPLLGNIEQVLDQILGS